VNECVYLPMVGLLSYLRANGFKTFIVFRRWVEFIRSWREKSYGIPPEQIVGRKPIGINQLIGHRPIVSFGNSDDDQQMLEWTAAGDGPCPEGGQVT
jgi:hypothetical protein